MALKLAIENGLADQSKGVATCGSSSAKSKPIVGNASRNGNRPSERQADRQMALPNWLLKLIPDHFFSTIQTSNKNDRVMIQPLDRRLSRLKYLKLFPELRHPNDIDLDSEKRSPQCPRHSSALQRNDHHCRTTSR